MNNYFKILRSGTHTSFQDKGFFNLQHLGITTGGVVDNELFKISNYLVKNNLESAVIEFAYQGPSLKLMRGECIFAITGNISFNIIREKEIVKGICYKTYLLKKGEVIDILSTVKSNYGYLAVGGGFKIRKKFDSYSTLTQSNIGSNNGTCLKKNQKIFLKENSSKKKNVINFILRKQNSFIRVIPGPQMHYFSIKVIKDFFNKPFSITKFVSRMGVRLEGNCIKSIKSHDIPSEGIVKGSIQVPGNGNPIVLLNDHPTIGGYPKIANIISVDIAKLAQFPLGTKFYFKEVTLKEAEKIKYDSLKKIKKLLG